MHKSGVLARASLLAADKTRLRSIATVDNGLFARFDAVAFDVVGSNATCLEAASEAITFHRPTLVCQGDMLASTLTTTFD
jgi:hypothetical protein